ncbi:hypothetical protein [Staphylococcus gallinarum]|uniref:hypothetical protein n=1 Tax=Staphylococcus gallinarum TaxID=1293 RepID=UPI001E5537BC|nr:hypothetical protein [Staphylococcus gallinarum]MCD8787454.1 hypothetical protein [Staphylococcus gallinarum]MCD8845261.1 hypothetical protein [Staphylococcus gallinarum]
MALTILMWLGIIVLGIFVFNFILSIIIGILVGIHETKEERKMRRKISNRKKKLNDNVVDINRGKK